MAADLKSLDGHPLDLKDTGTRLAVERTSLAVERTRLAHERTLMAWVRTATSLISFGFTVYKFFQYMQDSQPAGVAGRAFSPRLFGLTMIALGISALAMATVQHWFDIRALYRSYGERAPRSSARVVAAVVSCLGIVAFCSYSCGNNDDRDSGRNRHPRAERLLLCSVRITSPGRAG